MNWIVPCNPNKYNICLSLEKREVCWHKGRNNYQIGDVIYLYIGKKHRKELPSDGKLIYQSVCFKLVVKAVGAMCYQDVQYFLGSYKKTEATKKPFASVLFQLQSSQVTGDLTLDNLIKHGLSKAPQGSLYVPDQLVSLLEKSFS